MYIGRDNTFGAFTKQKLTPNSVLTTFALSQPAASANSLLVVYGNEVQEPVLDYDISGTNIVFTFTPSTGTSLYIIFLGTPLTTVNTSPDFSAPQTWAPTYGAGGSMTFTSVSTTQADYWDKGSLVYFSLYCSGTVGGSMSNYLTFSLPSVPAGSQNVNVFGMVLWDGSNGMGCWSTSSGSTVNVYKNDNSNYSAGASRQIRVSGFYKK